MAEGTSWACMVERAENLKEKRFEHKLVCDWTGMATQVEEDGDDMDLSGWSHVVSGRGRGRNRRESESLFGTQMSKRTLEENSSDEGTPVVRKKTVREEFKIILKFKEEEQNIQIGPIALSRELKKKIGDISFAKTLRDGSVMIICKTEEQKNRALNIESICRKNVKEKRIIGEKKVVRGVITGIPVNEDLEKLKKGIQDVEVIQIKRLLKTINGERVESPSVMIEFQENILPERIKIGFISFPVRPYIPPPLRCYKCQRYGHIAAVCRGKQRCPKCGGDHKYEECGENVQDKCCNCGGQHRVSFGGCEVRKKAIEVEKTKTSNNISYAEAVKRVEGQAERKQINVQQKPNPQITSTERTEPVITVEKIMLFIAYVINCADQVKYKTEKIKIIVKGAEKFFGIKDISWEHINKELGGDGKSGTSGERTL